MTFAELGIRDSYLVRALVRQGVLVSVAEARYYLDREAQDSWRRSRQRRVLAVLVVVVAGFLVAWYFDTL